MTNLQLLENIAASGKFTHNDYGKTKLTESLKSVALDMAKYLNLSEVIRYVGFSDKDIKRFGIYLLGFSPNCAHENLTVCITNEFYIHIDFVPQKLFEVEDMILKLDEFLNMPADINKTGKIKKHKRSIK